MEIYVYEAAESAEVSFGRPGFKPPVSKLEKMEGRGEEVAQGVAVPQKIKWRFI
jgi:hypothetical protein